LSSSDLWLKWLEQLASQQGLQLSVVGGAVRDQLLGLSQPSKDLDLVVEGSRAWPALELKAAVEKTSSLPNGFVLLNSQGFDAFGTAQLQLSTPDGPLLCDLSSARLEHYPFPGAHPYVSLGSLENDLHRRDFSLNAMAQRLPAKGQHLLDPFHGARALEARQLELLHPSSLSDDPTRLVRGVRYAARLNLTLSPDSAKQAATVLQQWPWPQEAPALAARLRMELELLFEEPCWPTAVRLLQQWGGLELLFPNWQELSSGSLAWLQHLCQWGAALQSKTSAPVPAGSLQLLGLLLLAPKANNEIASLGERLHLPQGLQNHLEKSLEMRQWLQQLPAGLDWDPSQWTSELESRGTAHQPTLALLVTGPNFSPWRRPLLRWLWRWRLIQSPASAQELLRDGWSSGPALGAELRRQRSIALNQQP
jgi:poly(A) polymerase